MLTTIKADLVGQNQFSGTYYDRLFGTEAYSVSPLG